MKFNLSNSFDEARILDSMLLEMAAYDVTGGLVPIINKENYQDTCNQIFKRFNQFKRGIQLGEYTFESIKDNILSKNGPYPQKKISDEEAVEELINPSNPTKEKMTISRGSQAMGF